MDPAAVLSEAECALDDDDVDTSAYLLAIYRDWREDGGFEPPGGDTRWAALSLRFGAMMN